MLLSQIHRYSELIWPLERGAHDFSTSFMCKLGIRCPFWPRDLPHNAEAGWRRRFMLFVRMRTTGILSKGVPLGENRGSGAKVDRDGLSDKSGIRGPRLEDSE